MEDIKKIVGTNLKALQNQHGLTQGELAQKLNVHIRHIATIEAGKTFISAELLSKICKMFNIDYSTLLDINTSDMIYNSCKMSVNLYRNKELLRKLRKNIKGIANDTEKLEFLNFAVTTIKSEKALEKLKYVLMGMDIQSTFDKQ